MACADLGQFDSHRTKATLRVPLSRTPQRARRQKRSVTQLLIPFMARLGLPRAKAKRAARTASPPPTNGFRPSAVSEGDEIVGSRRAAEVGRLKRVSKAFPFPFPRGEGEENSSW